MATTERRQAAPKPANETPATTPPPEDVVKPQNVIEAICVVARRLGPISKDQIAPERSGGYRYRGIEQISERAAPLFAEVGVVLVPVIVRQWEMVELEVNGKRWTDDRCLIQWRCYGPGGSSDFIDLEVPGIGRDNSDKGSNKAVTQSRKYAMLSLLTIADQKDDSDSVEHAGDAEPRREYRQNDGGKGVEVPKTWAQINSLVATYGDAFVEDWRDFERQALVAKFDVSSMRDLAEGGPRQEFFRIARSAIVRLKENHPEAFPPPARRDCQEAWAAPLDGIELAGPDRPMDPDEAEAMRQEPVE